MYPRLCLTGRLCCAWKGRIKPLWCRLRKRKYSGSRPHQSRRMKPLWRCLRKRKYSGSRTASKQAHETALAPFA